MERKTPTATHGTCPSVRYYTDKASLVYEDENQNNHGMCRMTPRFERSIVVIKIWWFWHMDEQVNETMYNTRENLGYNK